MDNDEQEGMIRLKKIAQERGGAGEIEVKSGDRNECESQEVGCG